MDGPLRLRALVAATPPAVWAACVLMLVLGVLYSVLVPVMHGPDEYAHVDRVLGEPLATVDPGLSDRADRAIALQGLTRLDWRVAPSAATDVVDSLLEDQRPAWQELGAGTSIGEINQGYDHPPTYYGLAAAWDRGIETLLPSGRYDLRIGRVRLLSSLLLLPLPWLAWAATRRLRRDPSVALGAALVPLGLPMLAQTGGTVSNDALVTVAGGIATLGIVWIATGDRSWSAAMVAAIAGGLAAGTKVFGLGVPLWILAAVVVGRGVARLWPSRSWWAATGAAGLLAGAWWPLSRLLVDGTFAPRRFAYEVVAMPDVSIVGWLSEAVVRLPRTTISLLGVEQFGTPTALSVTALLLLVVIAAVGVARLRGVGMVLALTVATSLAMITWASVQAYLLTGLTPGIRGRYLFVGIVGISVLVAVGLERLAGGAAVPWLVGGLGLALHLATVLSSVDGFWRGAGLVDSARTAFAAAPLGQGVTVIAGVLAVVAMAVVVRGTLHLRSHAA